MTRKPAPTTEIPAASTRRPTIRVARLFEAFVAGAVFTAVLAGPAAAGHGSVSYENPKKIAEQKQREKEAATGQPAVAPAPKSPAAVAPAVATPAGAMPAAAPAGDRNHVYATTARRELSELATIAEEQITNGTDPDLAKLAGRQLESIRKQLAELDQWLAAHPQSPSAR